MNNKHGHKNRYKLNKALRRFSSLAAWMHFRKSSILELKGLKVKWLNRINVRRLSWDLISTDFIKNLVPYCPSALVPSKAFTMAEILISLTIIGVIAAITLPSLRANINEKAWATQRKALYSRMSQAISMMPSLNGYGIVMNSDGTVNETETASKAAQAFITDGLSKVLKINNICDSTHLTDCGLPDKIKTLNGNRINFPKKPSKLNSRCIGDKSITQNGLTYTLSAPIDTFAAGFETHNGESIATFYSPLCNVKPDGLNPYFAQPLICANFIYDLNGKKGPNTIGKDIGVITALYSSDSSVVSLNLLKNVGGQVNNHTQGINMCRTHNGRMTNLEELMALYANAAPMGVSTDYGRYSATKYSNNKIWTMNFPSGLVRPEPVDSYAYFNCVEK